MSLGVHWPVTRHGLYEQQPFPLWIIEHDIRHFSVTIDDDSELCQQLLIEVPPLFASVSGVDQNTTRRKTRRKFLDDCLDELTMMTGA